MAEIDKDTANWRLFGGGGLLVGGLLWTIYLILGMNSISLGFNVWLMIVGLALVGIGFFLVAWGETGSNGAVGADMVGKAGLWAAAAGFLLWAIMNMLGALSVSVGDAGTALRWVLMILVVVGLVVGSVVIMQKGVAHGLAKWAGLVLALVAIIYFVGVMGWVAELASVWTAVAFAGLTAVTGLLYLLNRK
jgi:hypothetical protein